jgi:hypothetical protein
MKTKYMLLLAVAIMSFTTITIGQTVPSYVPTPGLIGWWPFNGNATDESSNTNDGAVNGAILINDRFGNNNAAYSFNGSNSYISMLTMNNIPMGNSARTLSVWMNPSSISNLWTLTAIGYGSPSTNNAFMFGLGNNIISVQGWVSDYSSPLTYTVGQWMHAVCTYDGTNIKIYVDGALIGSGTNTLWNTTGTEFYFGARPSQGNSFFPGQLDDIGIWNRALTPQEITDLYNGCQLSVNTQPANQTININNSAQFITSSTDPAATYQWQTDLGVGFQNMNNVGQYSGTSNDTLTVANTTFSNNNQPFRCIINSGSCSDTSNVAVLTVNNNVGINENIKDNLFSVFPNPAQRVINVKIDIKLVGTVYTIYDNTGRVVLSGKLNTENTTIELGNLSGGIYMFSIGENIKQTFKIIKE